MATRLWHRALLSPDDFAFLRALLTLLWFEWGGQHFRMAHATPQGDLFEYLEPIVVAKQSTGPTFRAS